MKEKKEGKNIKSSLISLLQRKVEKTKALVLFSGGLDSMLAAKLLEEQGIEIQLIGFFTDFYGTEQAEKSAEILDLPLRKMDLRSDFLAVLKNPKHGFGSAANPCIDCHTLMLKKAGQIMREEGFDFVATGEVLGERSMSQNKNALEIVEKEAGIEGYLLRPLSAKLLSPTIAEKEGKVDREKLMDISGRSRSAQFELAKKYGIEKYPTPGGGCKLTQSGFAEKLKKLMEFKKDFDTDDAALAGVGRHFFEEGTWLIFGRNQEENDLLKKAAKKDDLFLEMENLPGPSALVRGKISDAVKETVKGLIMGFSPKAKGKTRAEIVFSDPI